jgi:RES domain-containing protein
VPTRTGFSRYHVVGPPARGFWRATTHHEPFDPPPAPPPIREVDPRDDDSGRWDAPAGEYRVLYCATEPEGALGEKLAPFMPNVSAVQRIEEFLEEEPDPDFADDYLEASLDAADIDSFRWLLAHAPAAPARRFIDVWHPATAVALFPRAASLLKEFGLHVLDIRALADERRPFTRRLGALIRKVATTQAGELRASGLRYDSRLPPRWECWALWEPLPLDAHRAEIQRVDIDTPALRTAAQLLGVVLRG